MRYRYHAMGHALVYRAYIMHCQSSLTRLWNYAKLLVSKTLPHILKNSII